MITAERLRKLLNYDPETGVFTWLMAPSGRRAGAAAGSLTTYGRRRVTLDGCSYFTSRLAWLYVTRRWPAREIDHININPSDDRFSNLREATHSQNGANRRGWSRLGRPKGIWPKHQQWAARIKVNHRQRYLGTFHTPAEACAAYAAAAKQAFGEYARP